MMVILDRKKLRAIRKRKALTQEELAERSGISDRYMRSIETSNVNPSATVLYRICRVLGVSMEELMLVVDDGENEGWDTEMTA